MKFYTKTDSTKKRRLYYFQFCVGYHLLNPTSTKMLSGAISHSGQAIFNTEMEISESKFFEVPAEIRSPADELTFLRNRTGTEILKITSKFQNKFGLKIWSAVPNDGIFYTENATGTVLWNPNFWSVFWRRFFRAGVMCRLPEKYFKKIFAILGLIWKLTNFIIEFF